MCDEVENSSYHFVAHLVAALRPVPLPSRAAPTSSWSQCAPMGTGGDWKVTPTSRLESLLYVGPCVALRRAQDAEKAGGTVHGHVREPIVCSRHVGPRGVR